MKLVEAGGGRNVRSVAIRMAVPSGSPVHGRAWGSEQTPFYGEIGIVWGDVNLAVARVGLEVDAFHRLSHANSSARQHVL